MTSADSVSEMRSNARFVPRGLVPLFTAFLLLVPVGVAVANPYPTPGGGTVEVSGAIEAVYLRMGGPAGLLGQPLTGQLVTPDGVGRYHHFERGSIFWSPAHGAYEVHGAIRDTWAALGWEHGALGLPTSDEFAITGGRQSDFQGGYISWTPTGGAVVH